MEKVRFLGNSEQALTRKLIELVGVIVELIGPFEHMKILILVAAITL